LVGVAAGVALAQDYEVSPATAQWVQPPTTATDIGLNGDDSSKGITLPFPISYYGRLYSKASVCTNGFIQFGGGTSARYPGQAGPLSGPEDGICAVAWGDDYGPSGNGTIYTWVEGTSPNRRFIVAWTGWSTC
jgi:hypothetical protein